MRLTVIARKRGADAIARKRGADAIGQSQRLLALAKERILATSGRKEQLTKSPSLFLTQQPIANEADTELTTRNHLSVFALQRSVRRDIKNERRI